MKKVFGILSIFILLIAIYNSIVSDEKNPTYHFQVYEIISGVMLGDSNLYAFTLAKKPIFTDKDLSSFNWANQTFTFKGFFHNKTASIINLGKDFRSFIVVADGQRIYVGGFYNSTNSPNIYLTINQNGGTFNYKGVSGYDKREDYRVLKALQEAGIVVGT